MIKIGNTILDKTPRIALVISDQERDETLQSLAVDVLEIRVDQFKSFEIDYIKENILGRKKTGIPLILTVRNMKTEGGQAQICDDEKLKIFEALTPLVDVVDIELKSPLLSTVMDLAKAHQRIVIVSAHNFESTPKCPVLEKIFNEAVQEGADIVKIATLANSVNDVNKLLKFTLKHKNDYIITISLGEVGSISRLVFPSVGSLLTYSYVGKPGAPGQVPLEILQEDLRRYYPKYNEHLVEKFGSRNPAE